MEIGPMRRMPAPALAMLVSAATIALLIFFGAWAVSADVQERDRAFSFAYPVTGTIPPANTSDNFQAANQGGSALQTADPTFADTWWGKSLIKACPLH